MFGQWRPDHEAIINNGDRFFDDFRRLNDAVCEAEHYTRWLVDVIVDFAARFKLAHKRAVKKQHRKRAGKMVQQARVRKALRMMRGTSKRSQYRTP